MGLEDLPWVVVEHRSRFPEGFFARLGTKFLTRYYRTFLDSPLAVAIVAEDDGEHRGYLAGVLSPQRHRKLLMEHHGVGLALSGLWGLITHPRLALTFARTRLRRYASAFRRSRRVPDETQSSSVGDVAVLSHVAVATAGQGTGIGTALISTFCHEAKMAGCSRVVLVTAVGEAGAENYYEHQGWQRASTEQTTDGRLMGVYELTLETFPTGDEAR